MIGTRTLIGRAAALAQVVLLALAPLVDGSGLHRCPAHGAMVPDVVESNGHASTHHHGAPTEGEHHGTCNCLGSSCGSAAQYEPFPEYRQLLEVARWSIPTVADGRPAPARPPHLLPFALGPPLPA